MSQRGSRHVAREYALRLLYGSDVLKKIGVSDPLTSVPNWWGEEGLLSVMPNADRFARDIFALYQKRQGDIDLIIQTHAKNWRIDRMAPVDRNILRLAVTEMFSNFDTPNQVVMNEAIELAKIYGDENSARFVNGILDHITRDIGSQKASQASGNDQPNAVKPEQHTEQD